MTKHQEALLIHHLPGITRNNADELTTTIAALETAAAHLDEFGWTKGRMFKTAHGAHDAEDWFTAPSCLVGSIRFATGDVYGDGLRTTRIVHVVTDLINIEAGKLGEDSIGFRLSATGWNDAYAKNKTQVIRLLRRTARILRKSQVAHRATA